MASGGSGVAIDGNRSWWDLVGCAAATSAGDGEAGAGAGGCTSVPPGFGEVAHMGAGTFACGGDTRLGGVAAVPCALLSGLGLNGAGCSSALEGDGAGLAHAGMMLTLPLSARLSSSGGTSMLYRACCAIVLQAH